VTFFCTNEVVCFAAKTIEKFEQEVVFEVIFTLVGSFLNLFHVTLLFCNGFIKVDLFHDLIEIFKVKAIFLLVSDASRFH